MRNYLSDAVTLGLPYDWEAFSEGMPEDTRNAIQTAIQQLRDQSAHTTAAAVAPEVTATHSNTATLETKPYRNPYSKKPRIAEPAAAPDIAMLDPLTQSQGASQSQSQSVSWRVRVLVVYISPSDHRSSTICMHSCH